MPNLPKSRPEPAQCLWFARRLVDDGAGTLVECTGFASNDQPDGAVLDTTDYPNVAPVVTAWADPTVPWADGPVRTIQVSPRESPGLDDVWYVQVPEPEADPPAVTLIAFRSAHIAPGRVIDQATFTGLPIRSNQQVGAFRLWIRTGVLHQIYVNPHHRRTGIGLNLALAIEGYRATQGWPPTNSSGEHTELGILFINSLPRYMHGRIRPLTRIVPPMTPGDRG